MNAYDDKDNVIRDVPNTIYDLCWGNDELIAVGDKTIIKLNKDTLETMDTIETNEIWKSLAYGKNGYTAVSNGFNSTATKGVAVNFVTFDSPKTCTIDEKPWKSIIWNSKEDVYMALSSDGYIAVGDGIIFSIVDHINKENVQWEDLATAENKYIAVGYDNGANNPALGYEAHTDTHIKPFEIGPMPAGTKYHNISYDYNQSQFIAVGEHLANTFTSGITLMDWEGEEPIPPEPPVPPVPPEPPVPDEWIDSGFSVEDLDVSSGVMKIYKYN